MKHLSVTWKPLFISHFIIWEKIDALYEFNMYIFDTNNQV